MYEMLKKADKLTDVGKGKDALEILKKIEDEADYSFLEENGAKIAELSGAARAILGDAPNAMKAYLAAAGKDEYLRAQRGHLASGFFIMHYLSNIETCELYGYLSDFEKFFGDIEKFPEAKYSHKKLKIGYLLPKTTKSSLSNFIAPMLTKYDRNEFEVHIYAFDEKSDDFTREIKENATAYKILDISSYCDAAKVIRDDEIDVLTDFTAHGAGADTLSVLAYRPATVQIVGVGFPSVTNLSFVDYILSDDFLTDDRMKDAPLTLKNALCFRPEGDMLKNLRKKHAENISFGVFNNFMKITDDMLLLWKEILDNLPDATLTLQDATIYEERAEYLQNRLKNLNFTERVQVKTASENYLSDMANTDIILDTFPYTGGFMTATAVMLGTPVVALAGERFSSKFSADILKTANLNEFIAYDTEEYKNIAVKLAEKANDEGFRESIRTRVLKSELADETAYMQNLERAYRKII